MKKFIRESLQEFDHVVWPTGAETKKYFMVVVSMISICALVLFIFGSAVTNALFAVRTVVAPAQVATAPAASDENTKKILNRLKSLSGATNTGSTSSGSVHSLTTTGSIHVNK